MGTVNVNLGDASKLNLILGQQLENAVTSVVFDFSAWQTAYGSGTLGLSVQRPGDEQPYAVTMTVSGTNATWSITSLDTAYKGVGEIQVTYTVGSVVKKSVVYKFTVYKSLGENGEYPSPGQSWQEGIEDEISDLVRDLSYVYNPVILNSSTIIQGGTDYSGNVTSRTDQIRTDGFVHAIKGLTIHMKVGTNCKNIVCCRYTTGKQWAQDYGWYSQDTDIVITEESYLVFLFRTASGVSIIPSQYDAVVTFEPQSIMDINNELDNVESRFDSVTTNGINLLTNAKKIENYYYGTSPVASNEYDYYEIPVTSGNKYTFGFSPRFISRSGTIIVNGANVPYTFTASSDEIIYVTYYKTATRKFVINGEGTDLEYYAIGDVDNPNLAFRLLLQELGTSVEATVSQKVVNDVNNRISLLYDRAYKQNGIPVAKDSLSQGEYLTLSVPLAIRKGSVYTAMFEATNLGEVRIGHGDSGSYYAYLKLTPTTWSVVDNGTETIIRNVGYSLQPQYMQVKITQKSLYKADIVIQYPGDTLTYTDVSWHGCGFQTNTISVVSGSISNIMGCVGFTDAGKKIMVLGDSYTDSLGWVGVYESEYDNIFVCGYGGATSERMIDTMNNLLYYGFALPKMIVFATGMNDGTDSNNQPNATWMTQVNRFLSLCESYNVTPVFQTIPTVPSINNESKNNWIRNSGYRYVDVAKAVGAQSDGTWYLNMLGSDLVHPTDRGSYAILFQYIRSLPEIIKNP